MDGGGVGLLDRAGELLSAMPVRRLSVKAMVDGGEGLVVELDFENLDRADVYVDGRPRASVDLAGGSASISVAAGAAGAKVLKVDGFAAGELVAARTLAL